MIASFKSQQSEVWVHPSAASAPSLSVWHCLACMHDCRGMTVSDFVNSMKEQPAAACERSFCGC